MKKAFKGPVNLAKSVWNVQCVGACACVMPRRVSWIFSKDIFFYRDCFVLREIIYTHNAKNIFTMIF